MVRGIRDERLGWGLGQHPACPRQPDKVSSSRDDTGRADKNKHRCSGISHFDYHVAPFNVREEQGARELIIKVSSLMNR
ncbi:hypothetical protein NDU88_000873 [Pleurodeles waltl]|uniref:Uncharacterized protein n=1 Tax=Pleurodeles waltl TaxID=8319 RepID=A0AAV7U5L7_PLEWA|nr:hypothetical protein NDU88_000873 [Pleurodeles waltl]